MKDMIIKNWEGSIAIDTTGRDMAEEMKEWTDEKGHLVLIEDGVDYRDEFVRQWTGLMNESFADRYLFDEKEKAREIILESRSYNEAYAIMCDLGFTDIEAQGYWAGYGEHCGANAQ